MESIRVIQTAEAPAAIGPYSQAIVHAGIVYTAGQVALDPASGELEQGSVAAQTDRVLRNLEAVLREAGASLQTVLKTTVFLRDMNDFAEMNEVYARHFDGHRPARSTVQAARLPRDVAVEIEAIAAISASGA
jgi:2-iminobutanoate/2-iminopropanoate deaminase